MWVNMMHRMKRPTAGSSTTFNHLSIKVWTRAILTSRILRIWSFRIQFPKDDGMVFNPPILANDANGYLMCPLPFYTTSCCDCARSALFLDQWFSTSGGFTPRVWMEEIHGVKCMYNFNSIVKYNSNCKGKYIVNCNCNRNDFENN